MRLPGDTACFVELDHVSVLPTPDDPDQRPFLRGAVASVSAASVGGDGGQWSVTVRGGDANRYLAPGDKVVITGTHRVTGDRFAVPVALECTDIGRPLRFAVPRRRAALPRWALAS